MASGKSHCTVCSVAKWARQPGYTVFLSNTVQQTPIIDPWPAKKDYSRFQSFLLADKITDIGNDTST